jgi:hypothetical protein
MSSEAGTAAVSTTSTDPSARCRTPFSRSSPKRIGSPAFRWIRFVLSSWTKSNAPSLKMLQFWKISTNAEQRGGPSARLS